MDSARLAQLAALSRPELEALQLRRLRAPARAAASNPARIIGSAWTTPAWLPTRSDRSTLSATAFRRPRRPIFSPIRTRIRRSASASASPAQEVALVNMTGGTSGQGQEIYGRSQRDVHMQGYLHALPWFLAGLAAGRHRHQLRSGRRSDHRRLGTWRGAAHRRRHRISCRRHAFDRRQDRSDVADRRSEFHLRLDQLPAYADRGHVAPRPGAETRVSDLAHALHRGGGLSARMGAKRIEEAVGLLACRKVTAATQCAGFGASTCADGVLSRSRRPRADAHVRMGDAVRGARSGHADAGQVRRDRRTRRHQSFDRRLAGDPLPHR